MSNTQTQTMMEPDNATRLEQAINFLGDEDIDRNYDFTSHHNAIDNFLRQLFKDYMSSRKTKKLDFDVTKWEACRAQVKAHFEKHAKDRESKSIDDGWSLIRELQRERDTLLNSDLVRSSTGAVIFPAPISSTNPNLPPEVPLYLSLEVDDPAREKFVDPLLYTKQAAHHRRLKEYAAKHVEGNSITSHIPAPTNFHGPYIAPLSTEEAEKAAAARAARLNQLAIALQAAAQAAPRLLIEKVVRRVGQGGALADPKARPELIADDKIEDWEQWTTTAEAETPLTNEELVLLSILTEPSWNSDEPIWRPILTPRRPEPARNRHPEDRFTSQPIEAIKKLSNLIRYNGNEDIGPRVTMDSWAVFQRLGYRLGLEQSQLVAQKDRTSPEHRVTELLQEEAFEELVTWRFPELSIDDIIDPLVPPEVDTGNWTIADKTSILRDKLIIESGRTDTDRTLNHSKLWDFAALKPDDEIKQFFSLSRYPTDVMMQMEKEEMEDTAPVRDRPEEEVMLTPEEMAAMEKANVAAYFRKPDRERFVGGVPFYPFGETKVQEWLLSREIERDLEGVPGYSFGPTQPTGFLSKLTNLFKRKAAPNAAGNAAGPKRPRKGSGGSGSGRNSESDIESDSDDGFPILGKRNGNGRDSAIRGYGDDRMRMF